MASVDQLKSLASSKLGFARTNQFLVELPPFRNQGLLSSLVTLLTSGTQGGGDLNLLCNSVTLPGKQILTYDRVIGLERSKVSYGYAVEDITMTFYALNDYGIRKYFDTWAAATVSEDFNIVPYKNEYSRDIKIHQLRKPIINKSLGAGPININIGIGGGTSYSVRLIDAFPTTVQQIELNNELDGLVQINVQMSYTRWQSISDNQGFLSVSGGLSF